MWRAVAVHEKHLLHLKEEVEAALQLIHKDNCVPNGREMYVSWTPTGSSSPAYLCRARIIPEVRKVNVTRIVQSPYNNDFIFSKTFKDILDKAAMDSGVTIDYTEVFDHDIRILLSWQ